MAEMAANAAETAMHAMIWGQFNKDNIRIVYGNRRPIVKYQWLLIKPFP
jgi:hypothetical protein